MPEASAREVNARVLEALPSALFLLELEAGDRSQVTAHLAGQALLRVRPGDEVVVELSPRDPGRGRILRHRS